eukprot:TRINITY_DN2826_c1_g1_i2.p1 TRINITY_DN2826_c1_g1~~TRINITY_DN2826_c1_g1_i2.p1  ORF type:complete len:221 (+),score=-6.12 TRINITY_DN2826_c1_g1_i2:383-1045(+)
MQQCTYNKDAFRANHFHQLSIKNQIVVKRKMILIVDPFRANHTLQLQIKNQMTIQRKIILLLDDAKSYLTKTIHSIQQIIVLFIIPTDFNCGCGQYNNKSPFQANHVLQLLIKKLIVVKRKIILVDDPFRENRILQLLLKNQDAIIRKIILLSDDAKSYLKIKIQSLYIINNYFYYYYITTKKLKNTETIVVIIIIFCNIKGLQLCFSNIYFTICSQQIR